MFGRAKLEKLEKEIEKLKQEHVNRLESDVNFWRSSSNAWMMKYYKLVNEVNKNESSKS